MGKKIRAEIRTEEELERVGLIVLTADKRLSAPREKVVAEIGAHEKVK